MTKAACGYGIGLIAVPFMIESGTEAFLNCRYLAQPFDYMLIFAREDKSAWLLINRLRT